MELKLLLLSELMLRRVLLLQLGDPAVADDDWAGDAAIGDAAVGADAADAGGVHVPVVPRLRATASEYAPKVRKLTLTI